MKRINRRVRSRRLRTQVAALGSGMLLINCGGSSAPFAPPGYTPRGSPDASVTNSRVMTPTAQTRDPDGAPPWEHLATVWDWPEVSRGANVSHAFAGSETATVSTRASNVEVLRVLRGAGDWRSLPPGSMISQLVLSDDQGNNWSAAYVAERAGMTNDERVAGLEGSAAADVRYYVVGPDGRIETAGEHLCASCHVQR